MISLIVGLGAVWVVWIIFASEHDNIFERGMIGTLSLMMGCMVGAVAALFLCALLSISDYIPKETTNYKFSIISLRDDKGINGRFTLGSGYIHSRNYYLSYQEVGPKTYQQITLPSDDTRIVEDSQVPYGVTFETTEVDTKLGWWLNFNFRLTSPWYKYELHVPEGTIVREVKL